MIYITAKYCPVPPTIEQGGTVFANSTGNKYGAVCVGNDTAKPVRTNCSLITIQHEKSKFHFNFTISHQCNVIPIAKQSDHVYLY